MVALREIAAGAITRDYLLHGPRTERFTIERAPLPAVHAPGLDDEEFE